MTLNIELNDEEFASLEELARESGVTSAEIVLRLILVRIEQQRAFREAVNHTLTKNAELYRRLAKGPGQD
jgi:hypothetical protein